MKKPFFCNTFYHNHTFNVILNGTGFVTFLSIFVIEYLKKVLFALKRYMYSFVNSSNDKVVAR